MPDLDVEFNPVVIEVELTTGPVGPVGPAGDGGVPDGGTTGQVLAKQSATNGDAGWVSLSAADVGAQPLDSDLTAIAALATTAYGRALLALADAAAGRTALGLGTAAVAATGDFQPVDSDLTAIAALATTSYGRAFLALADAAAGRTALGLGTAATAASSDFAAAAHGHTDPTWPTGALGVTAHRDSFTTSAALTTTGVLFLASLPLFAGQTVTSISFLTGGTTTLAGATSQFFGLFDADRVALRFTGDDGSTAWAQNTVKTLNLSSTYSVTTSGLYYVGICIVASTMPQMTVTSGRAGWHGVAPIKGGLSTTGLTGVPSLPFTAAGLTAGSSIPVAWVA